MLSMLDWVGALARERLLGTSTPGRTTCNANAESKLPLKYKSSLTWNLIMMHSSGLPRTCALNCIHICVLVF